MLRSDLFNNILRFVASHRLTHLTNSIFFRYSVVLYFLGCSISAVSFSAKGIEVIPAPQEVTVLGSDFCFDGTVTIVLDRDHSDADQFAAEELVRDLKKEWNISARISDRKENPAIILSHHNAPEKAGTQGYRLIAGIDGITIRAGSEEGLFYGTQTLLQLIRKSGEEYKVPGIKITDWPDIKKRAVHYDTKHHQDKISYVKSFIKDLSRYKINILVWEWEDKFAYPDHPEIGAPGAFTLEEIQDLTRYARQYHIQIVPLVQGLGHASFILKWPHYKGLREIEASNWEFCPLRNGTYDLLFDLWDDAIKATPGSEYIHIGSDETYELGSCEQCKKKAEETGKSGLYQLFVNKAAQHLQAEGRKVMVWERPMQWERGEPVKHKILPVNGLALTESYHYNTPDFKYARRSRSLGFEVFAYDPNPGTTALFLPYNFKIKKGKKVQGCLEDSYDYLSSATLSGAFDGMICTSWDDAGLHNQMWMLHFINAAEYAWSGSKPGNKQFKKSFFRNYYGDSLVRMDELFYLLNKGALYFMSTFERNVWHYGEIGKTHLPDLPRGQLIEFDPYWKTEYQAMINLSESTLQEMDKALQIIENNYKLSTKHGYDFEIFRTVAALIRHTSLTYLDLSKVEQALQEGQDHTFLDQKKACDNLVKAQKIVENILSRREQVFTDLVETWEETRLPKGMQADGREYFWQQDRARHFANRKPDMTYLIYDEQLLDMEGYLEKLKAYIRYYKSYYDIIE